MFSVVINLSALVSLLALLSGQVDAQERFCPYCVNCDNIQAAVTKIYGPFQNCSSDQLYCKVNQQPSTLNEPFHVQINLKGVGRALFFYICERG